MTKFLPEADLMAAVTAVRESPTKVDAAMALGITRGKLEHRLREAKRRKVATLSMPVLPSYQASAEEIIQRKLKIFDRRKKAQDSRELIRVKVNAQGPIGILHMGDPHLDDDGTNIQMVIDHLSLSAKTDGLFIACVGDYLNNWRGKLAPLHAPRSVNLRGSNEGQGDLVRPVARRRFKSRRAGLHCRRAQAAMPGRPLCRIRATPHQETPDAYLLRHG